MKQWQRILLVEIERKEKERKGKKRKKDRLYGLSRDRDYEIEI